MFVNLPQSNTNPRLIVAYIKTEQDHQILSKYAKLFVEYLKIVSHGISAYIGDELTYHFPSKITIHLLIMDQIVKLSPFINGHMVIWPSHHEFRIYQIGVSMKKNTKM